MAGQKVIVIDCPTCAGSGKVENPVFPKPEAYYPGRGTQKYWDRWSHAAVDHGDGKGFGMYTKIYAIGTNSDGQTYTLNTEETSCPIMSLEDMKTRVKLLNRKTGEQEVFEK